VIFGALLALLASAAIVANGRDGPKSNGGSVNATIALTGGSCQTHKQACARLAHGGALVIIGPYREGSANIPQHRIVLRQSVTNINIALKPGNYVLAFFIKPPWGILYPD
jgi:hypothetical protein